MLAYIQRSSAMGRTVCNDFDSENCSLMADQARDLMSRAKTKTWARHFTMSWHPDDTVYAGHEEELVKAFKEKFRAWKVYARTHTDKDHGHCHLAVLEIDSNFHGLRYSGIAQGMRELAMDLENQYGGLKTGRGGDDGSDPQTIARNWNMVFSKNELELADRLHREGKRKTKVPDKMLLKAKVDLLVRSCTTIDELVIRGKAEGIEVRITEHDGQKGVSFSDGVTRVRGSAIGWPHRLLEDCYETKNAGGKSRGTGFRRAVEQADRPGRHESGAEGPAAGLRERRVPEDGLGALFRLLITILTRLCRSNDRAEWEYYRAYLSPKRVRRRQPPLDFWNPRKVH